ncbi:DUF6227 family protein [Streptomyces sp. MI02-7b]|uniref:DUF6227 family protein n=1 Tax=Streptomyces sp. MI02-7b TaxID=462941 RepID=UPI0029AE45DA|nr:DUF6227 family protein [Streptomyces sp. MI02-7b]MDX3073566.1 DUF6227 family protein [Streptomyces sp. MI02-7b]
MGNARPGGAGPADVEVVLARAQNAFEIDDVVLGRLETALMGCTELASFRQRKGPPRRLSRRTLRHTFLLADGGTQVLWEIEHNTGPGEDQLYEVYADPDVLVAAQHVIDLRFGEPAPQELEAEAAEWLARLPRVGAEPLPGPRQYMREDSAEHAWRVLRRAENRDAPGDDLRARLGSAVGHDIAYVTGRHTRIGTGRVVGWTLYEHAFLLASGEELSLWEVEHTMTPDGRPVCEVYADETVACDAADVRMEAL